MSIEESRGSQWYLSMLAGAVAGAVVALLLFTFLRLQPELRPSPLKSGTGGSRGGDLYPVRSLLPTEPGELVSLSYNGPVDSLAAAETVLRELLSKPMSEDLPYAMRLLFRKLSPEQCQHMASVLSRKDESLLLPVGLTDGGQGAQYQTAWLALCSEWAEKRPDSLMVYALEELEGEEREYGLSLAFATLGREDSLAAIKKAHEKEMRPYLKLLHEVLGVALADNKDVEGLTVWLRELPAGFQAASKEKLVAPFVALVELERVRALQLLKGERADFLDEGIFTEILGQLAVKDPGTAFSFALEALPEERLLFVIGKLLLPKGFGWEEAEGFLTSITPYDKQDVARGAVYYSLAHSAPWEILEALSSIDPRHTIAATEALGAALATIVDEEPDQFSSLIEEYGDKLRSFNGRLLAKLTTADFEKSLMAVQKGAPHLLNQFIQWTSHLHAGLRSETTIRALFSVDARYFSPDMRDYLMEGLLHRRSAAHYQMLLKLLSEGALAGFQMNPLSIVDAWLASDPASMSRYVEQGNLQAHPVIRYAYLKHLLRYSPQDGLNWIYAHENDNERFKLMKVALEGGLDLSPKEKLVYIGEIVDDVSKQVELARGVLLEIVEDDASGAERLVRSLQAGPWRDGYLSALSSYYLEQGFRTPDDDNFQRAASYLLSRTSLDWDSLGDVYDAWSSFNLSAADEWLEGVSSLSPDGIKYIRDEP